MVSGSLVRLVMGEAARGGPSRRALVIRRLVAAGHTNGEIARDPRRRTERGP